MSQTQILATVATFMVIGVLILALKIFDRK
jgi:hypothetical protein